VTLTETTRFADLVRGASLRGPPAAFSSTTSLRLGRAMGTVLRRQGHASTTVLVGRGTAIVDAAVRDGLVAGLVLSGLRVVDLGVIESDRFIAALRQGPDSDVRGADAWPVLGGVLVGSTGDAVGVMSFSGARPLVGEALVGIAAVAEAGAFVAAVGGGLTVVDTALVPWPRAEIADDDDVEAIDDEDDEDLANRTLSDDDDQ